MKKIVSVLLTVLMLCQCFGFVSFAADGVVEAPTKELIYARISEHADWYMQSSTHTNVTNGMYMYLYTDNKGNVSPQLGNNNTYYWNGNPAADGAEGGVYTLDSNNPSMKYVALSNDSYKTTNWGIINWKAADNIYFSNWPDKTTFNITFLDESTEAHKRTSGTGGLFGGLNDPFISLGANATETEGYMKATGSNITFGAANRWIDLKVEIYDNGGVKTRSSWWKYHEEEETEWKQLDDKVVTTSINSYAVFGPMTNNANDTARILLNNLSATRTYRAKVAEVAADGEVIETGADISYDTNEITLTFDQTMAAGQEDNIKLVKQDGSEADVTVTTEDDRIYTIAINEVLAPEAYSIDLSDCVSRHELYVEDEFTFTVSGAPATGEPEEVEAPTKELIYARISEHADWYVQNPASTNVTRGMYMYLYTDTNGDVSPQTGNSNAYYFNAANAADNTEGGVYTLDSNNPSMKYVALSNDTYKTTNWGVINWKSADTIYFSNWPDKTTFNITFLDESTDAHKRTAGTGGLFGGLSDPFISLGANATEAEGYMKATGSNITFGAANRWIDLKVEIYDNGGVKTRSSWWKYHEEDETEWKQLDDKVATTSINSYAMLGPMTNNANDTARILLNNFSATRTYRAKVAEVAVDGTVIETGAEDIPYDTNEITLTFDQTMAAGQEDNIKLVKQDGSEADITVTTEDDRIYTIAINGALAPEAEYTIDLGDCISRHELYVEDEFTFTVGESPIIDASAAADISAIDWKKSNTIDINFSSAIVPSTVTKDTVKLQFADGTPVNDVPLMVEADADSAQITLGQLQAWSDYKLVFTDGIEPASDANIFNGAEVRFGTDHADIVEYDYNKEGSINGKVISSMTTSTLFDATATGTDAETGLKYSTVSVEAKATATNAFKYVSVPGDYQDEALSFQYKVRMSPETENAMQLALYHGSGQNWAVNLTPTEYTFNGSTVLANNNQFVEIKVNLSADAYTDPAAKTRTTTNYLMTDNGWAQQGNPLKWTNYFRPNDGSAQMVQIAKYYTYANKKTGPADFARVILSSNPKADVMKLDTDYNKSEFTVALGKNMVADQTAIVVKKGTDTVEATVTPVGSNTYKIKVNEVIVPGTEYTLDMSALMCADGVVGAQNYTFTTPKAPIATDVFSISANTGSVQVTNNTGAPLTYTVIVAVYDSKNALKKVAYETYSLAATDGAQSELHTVTADLSEYASVDKTGWTSTLMLWKGDISDASPACASIDGTIQ